MLTNVGAAGIQQLLVHNRHTVLGKNRLRLEGEGSQSPFPHKCTEMRVKQETHLKSFLACFLLDLYLLNNSWNLHGPGLIPILTKPCSDVAVSTSKAST